jgi:hypothetical protein
MGRRQNTHIRLEQLNDLDVAAPPGAHVRARAGWALLELANLVRGERQLEELRDSIAATIASGLGWPTVVINLYRPAWDRCRRRRTCAYCGCSRTRR